LSWIGPCGLLRTVGVRADHVTPPSVERVSHSPRPARRSSAVMRSWAAFHEASLSSGHAPFSPTFFARAELSIGSWASEVKVVTRIEPLPVSITPASRSSMGLSSST